MGVSRGKGKMKWLSHIGLYKIYISISGLQEYPVTFSDFQNYSFWILNSGNEKIYKLTSNGRYELRGDLRDWEGHSWHAVYKTFNICDETSKYKLTIGGYTGNAGNW